MATACAKANAQTVLTLEQCRAMALENNESMKNAANNVESAVQTRKEARTNYFPTVSATGMGYNANKGVMAMSLAGMDISLMKNGVLGAVTAVQPLFAGGQIVNGNKLAKTGVEVSRLQMEMTRNEVEHTVEQYYWQVVTLEEKLRTVNAVDTMLQRICADAEAAVNAGVINRNDLLQAKLKLNETRSAKINLQNAISLCKMLLAQYIGTDNTDFTLDSGIDPENTVPSPDEIYCEHQQALPTTSEYRLLEKNVDANRLQLKLSVGKNMPSVGVGAGYVYHDLLDNSRSFGMVFATVSVPISQWWGGSHAIKRQRLQLQNAENDRKDKAQLLMINMQKAWNDVQDAYKQLAIAKESIAQSTENLRLNNDYYRAGTSTMTDLLNAQTLYQQSRDKYSETYTAYQLKRLEYLQSTGR